MVPGAPGTSAAPPWPAYLGVQLDGRCIGWVAAGRAAGLVARLRALKAARLAAEEGPLPGVQYASIAPMARPERWHAPPLKILQHSLCVLCWYPSEDAERARRCVSGQPT